MPSSTIIDRARRVLAREGLPGAVKSVVGRWAVEPLQKFSRLSKRDLARGRRTLKVDGNWMELPSDMAWAFPAGKYYEHNVEFWFLRVLDAYDSPTVYDVGANYGYYTLLAANRARTVVCFEPVSRTFAVLNRNLSRNRLTQAVPLKVAVGEEPGEVQITLYSSSGNNTVVPRAPRELAHLEVEGSERVRMVSLDQLVADGDIPPPDIVKIDIEGNELSAIRGARTVLEEHQPAVLMEHEAHIARDAGYSLGEIGDFFERLGYRTFLLRDPAEGSGRDDFKLYPLHADGQMTGGTVIALSPRLSDQLQQ